APDLSQGQAVVTQSQDFSDVTHCDPLGWHGVSGKKPGSLPKRWKINALKGIPGEREHRFRDHEQCFRKTTEKCSRCAGIRVHDEPERVFTFNRNRGSPWAGICT